MGIPFGNDATHYETNRGFLGGFVAFSIITSFIAILGNSLVIYASRRKEHRGRLRYLDGAIRSLALTDLLYGLIGTPVNCVNQYLGRLGRLMVY